MSVRATVLSPLNTQVQYGAGDGGSEAEKIAELKAKLLLVVGTLIKVSQSTNLVNADYPLGWTTGEDYAIMNLNLKRTGAGEEPPVVKATVRIPFASTSYRLAGSNAVDIAAATVAAFITAYRDGQGIGGYTANVNAPSFYDI